MNRLFVLLLLALVFCGCGQTRETYTVVISMDASRCDYPDAMDTLGLNAIATSSVSCVMEPSSRHLLMAY